MSTTIRIMKSDKVRLERLAKKLGEKRLTEALRAAIAAAEREVERFRGNPDALADALRYATSIGGRVSERVDEELAKGIE